jgi:hypothetical protein
MHEKQVYKIAVVGSRTYGDLQHVRAWVDRLARWDDSQNAETVIVSGGAKGVDHAAETEAKEHGIQVESIRPDWDALGRGAGIVRNQEVVNAATDTVVAFWDGTSHGTKDAIEKAVRAGKRVLINPLKGYDIPK